jgi:hypothetical protein
MTSFSWFSGEHSIVWEIQIPGGLIPVILGRTKPSLTQSSWIKFDPAYHFDKSEINRLTIMHRYSVA